LELNLDVKFICVWEFQLKQFALFCRNTDGQDRYALEKIFYSRFLLLNGSIQFRYAGGHTVAHKDALH